MSLVGVPGWTYSSLCEAVLDSGLVLNVCACALYVCVHVCVANAQCVWACEREHSKHLGGFAGQDF